MKFEIPPINFKQCLIICDNKNSSFYNQFENKGIAITSYKNCKVCKANKNKLCWINAIYKILNYQCYYTNAIKYIQQTNGCSNCKSEELQINIFSQEIICPKCHSITKLNIEELRDKLKEQYEEIDQNDFQTAIDRSLDNSYKYDYKHYICPDILNNFFNKP